MSNENVRENELVVEGDTVVTNPDLPNTGTLEEGGGGKDNTTSSTKSKIITSPNAIPHSDAYTYYFSDIFTSSQDFVDTILPLMPWSNVDTSDTVYNDTVLYNIYGYISRHYHNINVRYSRKDDFISALAEVIDDCYYRLIKSTKLVREFRKIEPVDAQKIGRMLSSFADAPNEYINMEDKVGYITNQTYSQQEVGILTAYLELIERTPTMDVQRILNESGLDSLFMQVLPAKFTCYGGNNL